MENACGVRVHIEVVQGDDIHKPWIRDEGCGQPALLRVALQRDASQPFIRGKVPVELEDLAGFVSHGVSHLHQQGSSVGLD